MPKTGPNQPTHISSLNGVTVYITGIEALNDFSLGARHLSSYLVKEYNMNRLVSIPVSIFIIEF